MRNTMAIAWRETRAYFASPIAYVVAGVFVALTGYFFVDAMSSSVFPEASVDSYIGRSTLILTLVAPLLTMRLLSEEQNRGTIELLLTAPVRDWEVVLGKFISSLAVFLVAVALTLFYVVLLFWFGNPDPGPILTSYLGLLLFGGSALAVGLFTSSLTNSQIVAAVAAYGILALLTVTQLAASHVGGVIATVLQQASLTVHFDDFSRGILNTNNVVYYVTFTMVFLFLTAQSLEIRRWK